MNGAIYPPLLDSTFLFLTGTLGVVVVILSSLTTEDQTRRILGRGLDRYGAISEEELSPELESAGKTRFYSLSGFVAVLASVSVWRLLLFYGAYADRFLKAQGWPEWLALVVAAISGCAMPFLFLWSSRWLIRRRLDRRFAGRIPE